MKIPFHLAYVMGIVFIVGETARRGIAYFAINATTMIEDYSSGVLLLVAALCWFKRYKVSEKLMAAAWGYATGGMFVPFFAHLEAWLRDATFRPDHPHTDVASIVVKALVWAICLTCLILTLRSDDAKKSSPR